MCTLRTLSVAWNTRRRVGGMTALRSTAWSGDRDSRGGWRQHGLGTPPGVCAGHSTQASGEEAWAASAEQEHGRSGAARWHPGRAVRWHPGRAARLASGRHVAPNWPARPPASTPARSGGGRGRTAADGGQTGGG
uniref:Uncharacterized protein n=1 Tax=Arundo donax TaxID=35708 RepID=A0A0A9D6P8_ARUDO